jgi:hypothetical protein
VLGVDDTRHVNQSLAAAGLQPDQPLQPEVITLWPDNWLPVQAALRLRGQYVLAPSGYCLGYRLEAIESVTRAMQIPRADRLAFVDDLIYIGHQVAGHLNDQLQ